MIEVVSTQATEEGLLICLILPWRTISGAQQSFESSLRLRLPQGSSRASTQQQIESKPPPPAKPDDSVSEPVEEAPTSSADPNVSGPIGPTPSTDDPFFAPPPGPMFIEQDDGSSKDSVTDPIDDLVEGLMEPRKGVVPAGIREVIRLSARGFREALGSGQATISQNLADRTNTSVSVVHLRMAAPFIASTAKTESAKVIQEQLVRAIKAEADVNLLRGNTATLRDTLAAYNALPGPLKDSRFSTEIRDRIEGNLAIARFERLEEF